MKNIKKILEGVYENIDLRKTIVPLFIGDPGVGKEISINTPVLTKFGWKKAGEIKIGEIFYDANGNETNVIGVHPQGIKRNFNLNFNDGYSTNCGLDHLWNVKTVRQKDFKTMSLKEILNVGVLNNQTKSRIKTNRKPIPRFIIPITKPIKFEKKCFKIPPYLLGILIGDGCLTGNSVLYSQHVDDKEISEKIKLLLNDEYISKCRFTSKNGIQCSIRRIDSKKSENLYMNEVNKLKLDVYSHMKFIPKNYLFGSIDQRIELLRGLMDSDGHASKFRNKISYSTSSFQLAGDVVKLIQSLGGLAHINSYTRDGKRTEHIVVVKLNICPFSLKRKAAKWKESKFTRRLVSVEEIHEAESVCFTVDSPDKLFIMENYIVTHNTQIIEAFAKEKKVKLVELITSQMSPFEISGIAMK